MKVTNLDLHNRVRELKQEVRNLKDKLDSFEGFDPRDDIQVEDKFEMLWFYKGTYYRQPSELYPIALQHGYTLKKSSWRTMLKNPNRQREYNIYDINLVYVSWINEYHGVTTNGDIIKYKSLNRLKKENNRVIIYNNGERDLYNVGAEVYRRFIDRSFDGVQVHHKNGNMTDCRIDNIELYDYVNPNGA